MRPDQLDEKEIFNIVRQIDSPAARTDYLAKIGGDDPLLADRINALLRGFEKQNSFLESPAVAVTVDQPTSAEAPGVLQSLTLPARRVAHIS